MSARKPSSRKNNAAPNLRVDVDGLFRKMEKQRVRATEMIIRARAMRARAIAMQGKASKPTFP